MKPRPFCVGRRYLLDEDRRDVDLRLDDLRPDDLRPELRDADARLRGVFSPFSRASFNPIAIACLRLVTLRPPRVFSVPRLRRRIALPTVLREAGLDFAVPLRLRPDDFRADDFRADDFRADDRRVDDLRLEVRLELRLELRLDREDLRAAIVNLPGKVDARAPVSWRAGWTL